MKKETNDLIIIGKRNRKMNQKRLVLDRKYSKMLGLRKEKLEAKKQKEIVRAENKFKKAMDRELHNLTHKRQRKEPVDKTVSKLKAKALSMIQKYRRYKFAVWSTEGPKVLLLDTLTRVPLDKKVNGGHVYSQRNYPQLAFVEENIRPISSWGNRKQLDTIAEWKKNIPTAEEIYIDSLANDKSIKRGSRDRKFYEEIIEIYEELCKIEEKRLGILSTKK